MKRISISFLCILLSVAMSGCGKSDAERVQDYLEKRYGEEFVVIDTKTTSYGGPACSYDLTASCYPVDNPEYIFLAEIIRAGTEEKTYSDCYAQGILNRTTLWAETKDAFWEISWVRISSETSIPFIIICCLPVSSY